MACSECLEIGLVNAAKAHDAAATDAVGQLVMIGWLPALAGLVAAFWGLGLGGLRTATLPKWFAVATIVLGVIGVLGPLAFVVYLLLPVWLIVASVVTVIAGRRAANVPSRSTDVGSAGSLAAR